MRRGCAERKDRPMQSDAIYDDKSRHRVRYYAPAVEARDHMEVSVV